MIYGIPNWPHYFYQKDIIARNSWGKNGDVLVAHLQIMKSHGRLGGPLWGKVAKWYCTYVSNFYSYDTLRRVQIGRKASEVSAPDLEPLENLVRGKVDLGNGKTVPQGFQGDGHAGSLDLPSTKNHLGCLEDPGSVTVGSCGCWGKSNYYKVRVLVRSCL